MDVLYEPIVIQLMDIAIEVDIVMELMVALAQIVRQVKSL